MTENAKQEQLEEQVKYRLYAMRCTEENVKAVQNSRFFRITPSYILLYERIQRTINYNVIGEEELKYLTDADKQWLLDCNMAIIAEETKKHEQEVAARLGRMVERLEAALEEESSKENSDVRNDKD